MSGKTKRILYYLVSLTGLLLAIAGTILEWYFARGEYYILPIVAACFLLLPLNVILHEFGHVLFGAMAGMKFVYVKIGYLIFGSQNGTRRVRFTFVSDTAGETGLFPKSPKHVRGRFLWATLGGALLNFIYAGVWFAMYFFVSRHPALLFFEMSAPLSLYEGLMALFPVELKTGKTDGLVAAGLLRRNPEELIATHVLAAQGYLYKGGFSEIPEGILFESPVVRADLPAWHALLLLRMQYFLSEQRESEAHAVLLQLEAIKDELSDAAARELSRYTGYFEGNFTAERGPLAGVNLLETRLELETDKKNSTGRQNSLA